MGFWFADRRLRVILQKEVRPLPEIQTFAFSDNIEDISVSGLQAFSKLLLRCLPVSNASRFFAQDAGTVPVAHPLKIRVLTSVHSSILFKWPCHSPSPV